MIAACITGAAALHPLGIGAEAIVAALARGCEATAIDDAVLRPFLEPNEARRADRLSKRLLVAAKIAARDAGLSSLPADRIGLVVGTGLGCLERTEDLLRGLSEKGLQNADPMHFADSMESAAAAHCTIALGATGPSASVIHREISGEMALIRGALLLLRRRVDAVVVVAGDAAPSGLRELLPRLGGRRAPGEAAAALVLESTEGAKRRRASPIGRLLGYAQIAGTRERAGFRDAAPATVHDAREAAIAAAGRAGVVPGDPVLDPEDLFGPGAFCPGDGVLRAVVALERLRLRGAGSAWVARGERGGSAAAVLLGVGDR